MKSLFELKQKGRTLRKHLEAVFDKEVSLSQAYEALAVMEGAESWNVLSAKLSGAPALALVGKTPAAEVLKPALPIRAILRTGDGKAFVVFDAAPWFAQATVEQVGKLKEEKPRLTPVGFELSYGKGPVSDEVAEYFEARNSDVQRVFAYINACQDNGIECGFDCYIDAHDVQRWAAQTAVLSSSQVDTHSTKSASATEGNRPALADTGEAPVIQVLEVNLVDVLNEYEAPEEVPEWRWVEQHHSFAHKGNGVESGVWEYLVNVEKIRMNQVEVPTHLRPYFDRANREGIVWVLCHQG